MLRLDTHQKSCGKEDTLLFVYLRLDHTLRKLLYHSSSFQAWVRLETLSCQGSTLAALVIPENRSSRGQIPQNTEIIILWEFHMITTNRLRRRERLVRALMKSMLSMLRNRGNKHIVIFSDAKQKTWPWRPSFEQVDDQSFDTQRNLATDFSGSLKSISEVRSLGKEGVDLVRLLFFFSFRSIFGQNHSLGCVDFSIFLYIASYAL